MQLCMERKGEPCRGIRSPDFDVCMMVSVYVAVTGGCALPWMQAAGSSVLILPLHTSVIVAALFYEVLPISAACFLAY